MTPFYAARRPTTMRTAGTLVALLGLSICACTSMPQSRIPVTQQQYQFTRKGTQGPFTMQKVEVAVPRPDAHQVLIRVHATSLNRRDIFVLHGQSTRTRNHGR